MPLTREQFNTRLGEILGLATAENHARVSEIVTELTGEYDSVMTASETATTEIGTLKENNEKLRKVNTDLFLKVGTPAKGDSDNAEHTEEESDESETLTYDNLFNEKGELI